MAHGGRRLAITGAFGYIGTQVLNRLERGDDFERIICVDIERRRRTLPDRFEFHRCDVREGERFRDILEKAGVDTVLHLAFVANPMRDTALEYDIDVEGSRNVIGAAEKLGVRRLVVASSDTVYGFFEGTEDHLTEDAPLRATRGFSYAENKVEMEALVAAFASRVPACAVVVLRPCIVMGPHMNNATGQSLRQPVIFSVCGYDPIMQFVHEEDVGEAFYLALTSEAEGIFNLAADKGVRLSRMARIMKKPLVPLPAWLSYPIVEVLYRLGLLPFGSSQLDYIRYPMSMDSHRIRRVLGFFPRYTSQETLESFRDARP